MSTLRTAWQCDARGALIGETPVQEDPLEPGVFLLPPCSTLIAPPSFDPLTHEALFAGDAWIVQALPEAEPAQPDDRPILATLDNRPETGPHQVAVIVNGAWEIVADWRGTIYWLPDGSRHYVVSIGETLPPDALTTPPGKSA